MLSPGTPVTSTNKTNRHDIAEILLKVALNTITITLNLCCKQRLFLTFQIKLSYLTKVSTPIEDSCNAEIIILVMTTPDVGLSIPTWGVRTRQKI